jgi:hypothetical protein
VALHDGASDGGDDRLDVRLPVLPVDLLHDDELLLSVRDHGERGTGAGAE